jgi:glycosyltransferase involved in cell wall biosynthesis
VSKNTSENRNATGESNSKVSVVIPAYNHEEFVVEAIESVLTQDYPSIELIVINDGSTDKTGEKIEGYLKEHGDKFKYISREVKDNAGLIQTLNNGLELSSGEYFLELASDDVLLPGSITKRVECIRSNPELDAVFADAFELHGDEVSEESFFSKRTPYVSTEHSVIDMLAGKARFSISTGIFKLSFLKKLGGFDADFRDFEDLSIKYRIAMQGNVSYLDEAVLLHRIHEANVSKCSRLTLRRESALAVEKLYVIKKKKPSGVYVRKRLMGEYLKYFLLCYKFEYGSGAFLDGLIQGLKIPRLFIAMCVDRRLKRSLSDDYVPRQGFKG